MADLTDVEAAIVGIVAGAIYPNGSSQPSALPNAAAAKIARGWPLPASLDTDLAAGNAEITVYPLGGSVTPTYQILDETYTITPAAVDMSASLAGDVITLTGTPASGEFLTIVADDAHVYSATGVSAAAILAALATQAQVDYPSASATSSTLTVPVGHAILMRQGGVGLLGKVIHRQRHSVMVTIWAPSDQVRTAAAILADIALKENQKLTMPDTSQCILRYLRSMSSDQQEKSMIYRRDLFYEAEFATVEQFAGATITSTSVSMVNLADNNSAIATALT